MEPEWATCLGYDIEIKLSPTSESVGRRTQAVAGAEFAAFMASELLPPGIIARTQNRPCSGRYPEAGKKTLLSARLRNMNSHRPNDSNEAASAITSSKKVIYDFGANNGNDIPYYLKKSDLVVAVEANPSLCQEMEDRFSTEIQAGKLCVERGVLVCQGGDPEVYFYLHKRHHVLGQFPRPDESVIGDFNRVLLPSQSVMQILRKHGDPYYIKIDIEGYDEAILKELFGIGLDLLSSLPNHRASKSSRSWLQWENTRPSNSWKVRQSRKRTGLTPFL